MIDPELVKILCCPETRKLNQLLVAGKVRNQGGKAVTEEIEGGLLRADGNVLYPIRQNIPIMLVEEGIWVGATAATP
jgi:uncharacterized protein YbaR (Trm112 family)